MKTRHALTVSVAKPRRLDDDEDGPHVNHSSTPDASGERHVPLAAIGAREEVPPCCVTVISADAWAAEDGFLDNRVPTRPPAAAGRLTLNA